MGRPLCDRPSNAPPVDPSVAILLDEARLFFDYLSENYSAALTSLETLEGRIESPDQRRRLLNVRAQIFIAQGKVDQAEKTIAFLRGLERKPASRIEWNGAGYTLTGVEPSPGQGPGWPDYLAWRASSVRAMLHEEAPGDHPNPDAPRVDFGFDPLIPRANLIFPDRPFFNDPIPPQEPGDRRRFLPPPRPPLRAPEQGIPRL
jgi:hypothetical protein